MTFLLFDSFFPEEPLPFAFPTGVAEDDDTERLVPVLLEAEAGALATLEGAVFEIRDCGERPCRCNVEPVLAAWA